MSREVRRVPLDFDWPLKKVWQGYISPYSFPPCEDCSYDAPPTIMDQLFPSPRQGSGYTPEAYAIAQTFYPHMIGGPMADELAWCDKLGQREVDNLVAHGRLSVWHSREPTEDNPRAGEWVSVPRTAEEVNAENRRGSRGFSGHDAINRGILVEFRCEQLGIPVYCPTCNGNCDVATDEERAAAEAWEGSDPPEGEGWQLWETTSEGSPTSPVFPSADELAVWMSQNPCGFANSPIDLATARRWVGEGASSVSMVAVNGRLMDGITFDASRDPS